MGGAANGPRSEGLSEQGFDLLPIAAAEHEPRAALQHDLELSVCTAFEDGDGPEVHHA